MRNIKTVGTEDTSINLMTDNRKTHDNISSLILPYQYSEVEDSN